MFTGQSPSKDELDRAGRLVLSAAVADDDEIESAASSPFLFTRVRAAISAQRARQEESGNWMSLILAAKRAVPAMALIAILAAVVTVWPALFGVGTVPAAQADEELLFGPAEPGLEQTVLAGRNGLSRDEVFNIIVDRNYEVNSK